MCLKSQMPLLIYKKSGPVRVHLFFDQQMGGQVCSCFVSVEWCSPHVYKSVECADPEQTTAMVVKTEGKGQTAHCSLNGNSTSSTSEKTSISWTKFDWINGIIIQTTIYFSWSRKRGWCFPKIKRRCGWGNDPVPCPRLVPPHSWDVVVNLSNYVTWLQPFCLHWDGPWANTRMFLNRLLIKLSEAAKATTVWSSVLKYNQNHEPCCKMFTLIYSSKIFY